ncbi:unnamed protein product [Urochloa decumbens]|uniref:CCHC-type domain-containing protein n=1 Tax=Urochloa decumbens TaxID=240449 RepID=A0ABC8Y1S5_9POAL
MDAPGSSCPGVHNSAQPPAGDPPAGTTPPHTSSSDPLAASEPASPLRAAVEAGEALELHYCSAAQKTEEALKSVVGEALKEGAVARAAGKAKVSEFPAAPTQGPVARRVSYKDALLKPRTFRPRFPPVSSHHGKEVWLQEERRGARRGTEAGAPSFREGNTATGQHSVEPRKEDSHYLVLLKKKAGDQRCFNCFASGHRISQCRDPPKCLVCSRFGHKARYCPRRRAPSAAAAASAAPSAAAVATLAAIRAEAAREGQLSSSASRRQGVSEERRMDPMGMEFTPGDISLRPREVVAAAARTQVIREEEHALELYALVAVQRDCGVPLTCAAVFRDAPHQLGVPEHELVVEGLCRAKFLLRFGSPALRNAALAMPARAIQVGNCVLNIMPWSRRIGASVGKLRFRARVCLEGVPRHARNTMAVAQLFSSPSFIDEIDCTVEREEERFCFTVWVWTDTPNDLALQGTLQLQEPIDHPDDYYPSMNTMELAYVRDAPLKTFDYEVLIHLDRVLDYTLPSASPGRRNFGSDISGIPSEVLPMADYPEKYRYDWVLGERDDRPARRVSVHARLGGRGDRSDRSPPRGGNGGGPGLNFRQRPPATQHDVARMPYTQRWDAGTSSSGGYGRRHGGGQVAGEVEANCARQVWRPKRVRQMGKDSDSQPHNTDDSFHSCVSEVQIQRLVDPMVEEASRAPCPRRGRSAWSQCSVEPTATDAGLARPGHLDGVFVSLPSAGQAVSCTVGRDHIGPKDDGEQVGTMPGGGQMGQHIAQQSMGDTELPREQTKGLGTDLCDVARRTVAVQDGGDQSAVHVDSGGKASIEDLNAVQAGLEVMADRPESDLPCDAGLVQPHGGLLIDLNEGCADGLDAANLMGSENGVMANEDGSSTEAVESGTDREVLREADGRLNRNGRDLSQRSQPRGIARFAVPLKKSLLCNPVTRNKSVLAKKGGNDNKRAGKVVKKGVAEQPVEEKATVLLMRTMGVLSDAEMPSAEAQEQFGLEFVTPVRQDLMGNMRTVFGMPMQGGAGVLEELVAEADD